MSLGDKIRAKRLAMRLTLRELAERTGLTHSFISQVERDLADPSITSLRKIADAMQTPLVVFFAEEACDDCVVRVDRRRKLQLSNSAMVYEILNPDSIDQIQLFQATLAPGFSAPEEPASHPMQECTLVLQGRLKLEIGSETFILEKGDSAGWDGQIPHRLSSTGGEPLVLISATSPPMFVVRPSGEIPIKVAPSTEALDEERS